MKRGLKDDPERLVLFRDVDRSQWKEDWKAIVLTISLVSSTGTQWKEDWKHSFEPLYKFPNFIAQWKEDWKYL